MADCGKCGAPLPAHETVCTYCGARNDIDLRGIHDYTVREPDTQRVCPHCDIKLQTLDIKVEGVFLIERCEKCLGLFFDPGELEHLIDSSVDNVYEIDNQLITHLSEARAGKQQPVKYIKCAVCGKYMHRINFGVRSGVIVDRCKPHGIWLDAGELRQLFEWVKAGGQLLHHRKEDEKKFWTENDKKAQKLFDNLIDQLRMSYDGYILF